MSSSSLQASASRCQSISSHPRMILIWWNCTAKGSHQRQAVPGGPRRSSFDSIWNQSLSFSSMTSQHPKTHGISNLLSVPKNTSMDGQERTYPWFRKALGEIDRNTIYNFHSGLSAIQLKCCPTQYNLSALDISASKLNGYFCHDDFTKHYVQFFSLLTCLQVI